MELGIIEEVILFPGKFLPMHCNIPWINQCLIGNQMFWIRLRDLYFNRFVNWIFEHRLNWTYFIQQSNVLYIIWNLHILSLLKMLQLLVLWCEELLYRYSFVNYFWDHEVLLLDWRKPLYFELLFKRVLIDYSEGVYSNNFQEVELISLSSRKFIDDSHNFAKSCLAKGWKLYYWQNNFILFPAHPIEILLKKIFMRLKQVINLIPNLWKECFFITVNRIHPSMNFAQLRFTLCLTIAWIIFLAIKIALIAIIQILLIEPSLKGTFLVIFLPASCTGYLGINQAASYTVCIAKAKIKHVSALLIEFYLLFSSGLCIQRIIKIVFWAVSALAKISHGLWVKFLVSCWTPSLTGLNMFFVSDSLWSAFIGVEYFIWADSIIMAGFRFVFRVISFVSIRKVRIWVSCSSSSLSS